MPLRTVGRDPRLGPDFVLLLEEAPHAHSWVDRKASENIGWRSSTRCTLIDAWVPDSVPCCCHTLCQ